jgi:hypothetical protein
VRREVALFAFARLFFAAAPTWAANDEPRCGETGRPWIRFEQRTDERRVEGIDEIARHVRAELARKEIDVCFSGKGAPIAVVDVLRASPSSVEVVVDVNDSVTHKRVSRALDLKAIPPDARNLAVAVGTDELLIASWVEVALPREGKEKPTAPPAVTRAVSHELETEPAAEIGSAFVFEHFAGGQSFFGLDARFGFFVLRRLIVTLRGGLRHGLREETANGSVRSTAWLLGAGARVGLLSPRAETFGLDAFARLDALTVTFAGEPLEGAVAESRTATTWVGVLGAALWMRPIRALRVGLEGSLGGAFRPVAATDSGNTVTAIEGLATAVGGEVALVF